MKEFHTYVKGFDDFHDCYWEEWYVSRGESEDDAIKYAKIMFLSEHYFCCESDLTVDLYFKEND